VVWRGLTGERSVHLADWPSLDDFAEDHELVSTMDAVREVCSAALSLRKAKGLRVRLPLPKLTVASPEADRLRPFADLVADEVNVKDVEFTSDVADYSRLVLTLVPRVLGPRLGGRVQDVIRAVKAGDWSTSEGLVTAGGERLNEGEYELKQIAADAEHSAPLPGGEGVVVLDTAVTPELAAEGLARDLIRVVQTARRDAGLDVADRITLVVEASPEVTAAVEAHREFVGGEVLATEIGFGEGSFAGEVGEGEPVKVAVAKA
jgi:isoleucyl-tRNA synthetase